ncbi:MAG: S-layer homology domain-containing protein, partial [Tumebacillaceae bacterium]
MRLVQRTLLCILAICLLVAVWMPHSQRRAKGADQPFAVSYVGKFNDLITEGRVIPRDFYMIDIGFTKAAKSSTAKAVSLTDSTGTEVKWQWDPSLLRDAESWRMILPNPLKRNESYHLVIHGGTNGVQAVDGSTLPTDTTMNFKTEDKVSFTLRQLYGGYQGVIPEIRGREFTAEKGPFHFRTLGMSQGSSIDLTLYSMPNWDTVWTHHFEGQETEGDFTIPETGTYVIVEDLVVSDDQRNGQQDFIDQITANELDIPDETIAPIVINGLNNYDVKTGTFNIAMQLVGPKQPVKQVEVLLDGKSFHDNMLNADGTTIQSSAINGAAIGDGVHWIQPFGYSPNSQNFGSVVRYFEVDNTDAFSDVPHKYWGHRAVELMYDLDIVHGVTNTSFQPERAISREEFASIIVNTLGLKPTSESTIHFADVASNRWSATAIQAAAQAKLIYGTTTKGVMYFQPSRPINRA